jgi:homoserine/homoserine lactone efflux protein
LVNALNPKGIIFYSAFMPQFVSTQSSILVQFIVLASTFLGLALITVIFYSLVASKVSELLQTRKFSQAFNLHLMVVWPQQDNYKKSGSKLAYRNIRWI